MMSSFRRLFALSLVCLAACGCGGPGDVTGKVTYNGKALAMGHVVIIASDKMSYSGAIGETGEYTVSKVPPGPAKVAISNPNPANITKNPRLEQEPGVKMEVSKVSRDKGFQLPTEFLGSETSGLVLTVRSGSNSFDIVMTGEAFKK